ncbi:MAG: hypothetical protein BGO76_00295 [Caedibacter sp. 38-128]|nr:hypothetical protein [Holosporales bacterium]OJX05024.1 MAG: hypothetical protein BGO76_00295 [Caedibacter sp. 38-128]
MPQSNHGKTMYTLPSIAPFDALKLEDGTYCFAHHDFWGDAPYFAWPKYVPSRRYPHDFMGYFWTYEGTQYSRLRDTKAVHDYMALNSVFFVDGTRIDPAAVETVIPARITMNDFFKYTEKLKGATAERIATFDLVRHLIDGGVDSDMIGVTGSILLKGEISGFSDFDLVLYGARTIEKSEKILRKLALKPNSPLYYRRKEEAIKFYHKYNVLSDLTPEEFSETFPQKVSQGIMSEIPFSIFQVPSKDEVAVLKEPESSAFDPLSKDRFEATVEDDFYSKYTYKCLYKIKKTHDGGKIYTLYCHDRACTEQAKNGDLVLIEASRINDDSYVIHPKNGYIKPIKSSRLR